jgi:hypothetical protein
MKAMITVKVNQPTIDTNGTSLRGYITTNYDFLVRKLGEPNMDFDNKVTCSWNIEFPDNSVATIYDWKMGVTPLESYDWHIGGFNPLCVEKVEDLLGIKARNSRF